MWLGKIFGIEIYCDPAKGKLVLIKKSYNEKILSRFRMENFKPTSTPTTVSYKLSTSMSSQSKDEISYISRVPTTTFLVV